jgi:hypothetical protein
MIGGIIKAIAYAKYPKAMLALNHPKKSAKLVTTKWDLKHAYAPRISAVGVALIALPVGYMLGRLAQRGREQEISYTPRRYNRMLDPELNTLPETWE